MNLADHRKGTYCSCCGRKAEEIMAELLKQDEVPHGKHMTKREWQGHTLYNDSDNFDEGLTLVYCEGCGEELAGEDIAITFERHPWGSTEATEQIVSGYKCSSCGHKEEF